MITPRLAFETILRLLHPALPPVVVEIDLSMLQPHAQVHYGSERTFTLPYKTRTPAYPSAHSCWNPGKASV